MENNELVGEDVGLVEMQQRKKYNVNCNVFCPCLRKHVELAM
jgi:hypothetical protein